MPWTRHRLDEERLAVADRYTSRIALVLDRPLTDVGSLVRPAVEARDLDRASPVRGQGSEAQEVHWGGRLTTAVVRQLRDDADGTNLIGTETWIGEDGLVGGLRRQAELLQGLARHVQGQVTAVRDRSALIDRDLPWLHHMAAGGATLEDAIVSVAAGEGTWWVRTHGAARLEVPDLELYGLARAQVPAAEALLRHVHEQLLRGGLGADLTATDGTPLYLIPVLEAWQHVPLDWPGVGRAGQVRGPGLDGPRATLSVRHRPRFGRHRRDLAGVIRALPAA